jgi:hypothetical protein
LLVDAAQCPYNFLPGRGRAGLDLILRQFHLSPNETAAIRSAFQTFIGTPDSELMLSPHLFGDRYC